MSNYSRINQTIKLFDVLGQDKTRSDFLKGNSKILGQEQGKSDQTKFETPKKREKIGLRERVEAK